MVGGETYEMLERKGWLEEEVARGVVRGGGSGRRGR